MSKPKMQATLDGYLAWAFERLQQKTGERNADICKWILREWLEVRGDHLREELGISREVWEQQTGENVRRLRPRKE